jgi:restriction endonuclease
VTIIESDAFVNVTGSVKSVTIRAASTKNIHSNAFPYYDENLVITYKADPDQYQTNVRINLNEYKKKKSDLEIVWNRVSGASGYQVQASTDSKMKEKVKTVTVNDNQTFLKKITITNKKNTEVYARVRPYTTVDGKKVYGRWSAVTE